MLLIVLVVAGCGESDGKPQGQPEGAIEDIVGDSRTSTFESPEELFSVRIGTRMDFCRTCHIADGIADTEDGRDFMLSSRSHEDYDNLKRSWTVLGEGVERNDILVINSDPAKAHGGGKSWPKPSMAYQDMKRLLQCWDAPDRCDLGATDADDPVEEWPLLGSSHARHAWPAFCEGKPDNAKLPDDPRTLVRPGVNDGKNIVFDAYWQECHAQLPEHHHVETCGEFRASVAEGWQFLKDILPGQATSVEEHNQAWKNWGYDQRPDNFDDLFRLRYGMSPAPFNNPYPLPGENPNDVGGGSGQLPMGLRQLKDEQGQWTSQIGTAGCFQCHGGGLEGIEDQDISQKLMIGLGNSNFDAQMVSQDAAFWANTPLEGKIPNLFDVFSTFTNVGVAQRGQNNAVGAFELLVTLLDLDSLGINPNPLKTILHEDGVADISHPLGSAQDTPTWWNVSHRPRKFFDAGLSGDSTRIIMAAGPGDFSRLMTNDGAPYRDHVAAYSQPIADWLLTLDSPAFPKAVDKNLARQGAILFHSLDLWSRPGNEGAPEPTSGNGSCASCHGAYSPRYVHDTDYLEDPRLEGIAASISPLDVIATDRARSDMLTPTLREGWDTTYWAFPEGSDNYIAPEDKSPILEKLDDLYSFDMRPTGVCGWEKEIIGYQAPPLYGVWASAPYLHNGSVPTVSQVLDPSLRPAIWQRKLRVSEDGKVKGFDLNVDDAYDLESLGWVYDELTCDQIPGSGNCSLMQDVGPSLTQTVENLLKGSVNIGGALTPLPDLSPGAFDKRLVYDTRILGNGNQGHEFTKVLTEPEHKAVLEYLKTL